MVVVLLLAGLVFLNRQVEEAVKLVNLGEGVNQMFSGTKAPDFSGGGPWLNSAPLTVDQLRGKVVLVDFWTYSCINCQRTMPYLRSWWDKYQNKGLVIIGVHTPEFEFEKKTENVAESAKELGVSWPVVQDNDYRIWQAYDNHFWPHKYLINQEGKIVYDHIGEGAYQETEAKIQELLGTEMALTQEDPVPSSPGQTPELYAGYERGRLGNREGHRPGQTVSYQDPQDYQPDLLYLAGAWENQAQFLRHADDKEAAVILRFRAKDVFLVMKLTSGKDYRLAVELDGRPISSAQSGRDVAAASVKVGQNFGMGDLYHLVSIEQFGEHVLRLTGSSPDWEIYAFTFGG